MGILSGQVRLFLFRVSADETSFRHRGFRGDDDAVRTRLECVGANFLRGYHTALRHGSMEDLAAELDQTELDFRGFAYEGAAMGLALRDALCWRPRLIRDFLNAAGRAHAYMVHVGVGWAWARMPWSVSRMRKRLDPLLSWLAFDGWGFHEGFFHWPLYLKGSPAPSRLRGYETRAFDQGLGRAWWFVNGANPELVAATIGNFPSARQMDLWSGAGLAAVYAGPASPEVLQQLREKAGVHWRHLAQGASFAAKARQRAGNLTHYTDLAARTLCGLSAVDAARLTDVTLENLPSGEPEPAYEIWRKRIQEHFKAAPQLQTI